MYIIESECIFCGACLTVCPENAVIAFRKKELPKQMNISFAINTDICNECPDEDLPLCYSVCPMDSIKINEERLIQ